MQGSFKEAYEVAYDKFLEGRKEERPFLRYLFDELDKQEDYTVALIEAPTGYGKSLISAAIAYWNLKYRLKSIIAFPLITLIEQQYKKFDNFINKITNKEVLGLRYMLNNQSVYLMKPITLTTIDTLSLTFFGIPPEDLEKVTREGTSYGSMGHYLVAWSSVFLSDIVLDEVHLVADSMKSINFLVALAKISMYSGQKLFLLSSTIPQDLKNLVSSKVKTKIIEFSEEKDKSGSGKSEFLENRRGKDYSIEILELRKENKYKKIKNIIEEENYERKLIIFDTRTDVINFYKYFNDEKVLVLHSHYTSKDKKLKMKELECAQCRGKFIIISTQSIEAGVDLSSNLLITEIAPLNSLVQRSGRFLRGIDEKDKQGKIYIWYDEELANLTSRYKNIYDINLTRCTLFSIKNILKNEKLNLHDPSSYKKILDEVYNGYYIVNENMLTEFINVFLNLERASKDAIDLFFKLEGSFVRDSASFPITWKERINNIEEDVVTIKGSELRKLLSKGLIKKAITGDKLIDIEKEIKSSWSEQLILKKMLKMGIDAFYAEINYDERLGLIIDVD